MTSPRPARARRGVASLVVAAALVLGTPVGAGTTTAETTPPPTVETDTTVTAPSAAVGTSSTPDGATAVTAAIGEGDDLPGSSPPAVLVWGLALSVVAAVTIAVFFVRSQRRAARSAAN
jgi:hypothetical protein